MLTRRQLLQGSAFAAAGLALTGCTGAIPTASATSGRRRLFTSIALAGGGDLAMLEGAGFDGLVVPTDSLLMPDAPEESFAAKLGRPRSQALPVVACNILVPGKLKITGPEAAHDATVARCTTVFARAKQAGVGRIVLGSGGARKVPEGFPPKEARAQFVSLLRRLAPLAQAQGVLLIPETLNHKECNFLNHLPELAAIVAEVDHPAVRMNADLYHMRVGGDDPGMLAEAVPWLGLVEIAEKDRRTIPGIAGDDFRPFFRVLAQKGWRGPLHVEPGAGATPEQFRRMFAVLDEQVRDACG